MKHFINEIKDIARVNQAPDFSAACDMFLANVNNTHRADAQYHYAGADQVDYKALYPRLKELQEGKAALVDFFESNKAKCNALYNAGKRDELRDWVREAV